MKDAHFETKAIHSGTRPVGSGEPSTVPICHSAGFEYGSAEEMEEVFAGRGFGHVYSRISNPTVADFELRLAALEGGSGACCVSSGMAAIACTLFALAEAGDEVVSSESLFGGTLGLFANIAARSGITVRTCDFSDPNAVARLVNVRTRFLFCETIGNPALDVPDLRAIAGIGSDAGVPLVLDGTLTTPCLLRACDLGASVSVHSTTKYITGNGSAVGGAIVDTGVFDWTRSKSAIVRGMSETVGGRFGFLAALRKKIIQNVGACASPFNASLHSLGIETLSLRMERHCSNALALAVALESSGSVANVNYPGLPGNRFEGLARRQFGGRFGGILTLRTGSRDRAFRFMNSLAYARRLANIGDTKTLVIHPASTIYRDCPDAERKRAGVTDDLVRVSVGIEHPDDIIADFTSALTGGK